MSVKSLFNLLFFAFSLASCAGEEPPPPDVSAVAVDLEVQRFDQALGVGDKGADAGAMGDLRRRFPEFSAIYFRELVPLDRGDLSPTEQEETFALYREFPMLVSIDSLVRAQLPDARVADLIADFERALRYYRHYLPEAPVPETLTTFISPFELIAFLYGDNDIAVGLDFFLGPDFHYKQVNAQDAIFSEYLSRAYTPDHFSEKLTRLLIDDYLETPRGGRLIDQMVHEGKKLYLLKLTHPETLDHILFEVSPEQMEWLRNNETQIYAHLQERDVIFSSDPKLIRNYTQPAPTTQGMPAESPGGAINYVGYRIIRAYLAANPDRTLTEVLAEPDGQLLLSKARYKPRT